MTDAFGVAVPARFITGLLASARASWRRVVLARAACVSIALALAVAGALVALDLALPLPADARRALRFLVPAAAALPLLVAVRRAFPGPDDRRLALLVEERYPQLDGVLSTALEDMRDGPVARAFAARLEAQLGSVRRGRIAPARMARPASMAGAALLAFVVVVLGSGPERAWRRWAGASQDAGSGASAVPALAAAGKPSSGFGALRLTIEPPGYTGLRAVEWDGEGVVAALPGSRARVRGEPVVGGSVRASVIGGAPLRVRMDRWWSAVHVLAATDRGLLFEAAGESGVTERVVVPLALLQDQPPEVELTDPTRDLVVARPSGVITIRATARDDYGIAEFHLAWIRSRGSGESFSFEEGRVGWSGAERRGEVLVGTYSLDLGSMGLEPGDVLHLRAVARDRNSVSGPGEGVSPTRVIRVARPDDMAEVTTLTGFPIEAEREPILSQRMIILLTERLLERAPRLGRTVLAREAAGIADEQAKLRARVGDQALAPTTGADDAEAHDSHDHDADPIQSVNRPLLEAFNAMWAAERELRIGELRASLPDQHRALQILQRLREGERVFSRARQQVAPVDLTAARGTGELDDVSPSLRSAAPAARSLQASHAEIGSLIARLPRLDSRAASLELGAAAARLLAQHGVDPDAAALVARAAESVRRERRDEAARLLVRARALLSPPAAIQGGGAPALGALDPTSAAYFGALGRPR